MADRLTNSEEGRWFSQDRKWSLIGLSLLVMCIHGLLQAAMHRSEGLSAL